jgi:hypothetical protein
MAFQSLSDLVQHFESGGNYTAVNPKSGAGGAFQFVPSTWRQYGSQLGIDLNAYPTAQVAPPEVQRAVFEQAVTKRGLSDWTCPGCNSALSSYITANPGDAKLPAIGDQPPAPPPAAPPPAAAPAPAPQQAQGQNPMLLASLMNAAGGGGGLSAAVSRAMQPVQDYNQRFFGTSNA